MNRTPSPRPVSYRTLLQNRNYARLWLGQLVSIFGDRLHQIALVVLVGSLYKDGLGAVGVLLATIALPSLLFGLFAGALVDRWNRQRVMIFADLLRFLLVLTIPILAHYHLLLGIYVVTALLNTVSLFFRPAKDGSIPNIVPPEDLLIANSLSSTTDNLIEVLGYPLAGALVGGLVGMLNERGTALAFYIDAGTYLFSALMIFQMRFPQQLSEQHHAGIGGLVRMVGEGLRFVRSHAVLLTNIMVIASATVVGSGTAVLSYGYGAILTGAGGFGYSVLQAAIGLGCLIGSLVIARWGYRFPKGPLILVGLIFTGVASITLTFFANLWFAAAILMLMGIGNMMFFIPSVTLVQQSTPDGLRGRVLSFRSTLSTTAFIASNLLLGFGAQVFGVQWMFGISGALLVLIGLLAFLLPSARNTDPPPTMRWPEKETETEEESETSKETETLTA